MACETRMSIIQPPTTYVYSVFFILGCVVAIVGNVISLIILFMPNQRSRSYRILISLALSDLLVGCIVFPITGYQVLNHHHLNSCHVDFTRVYSSVFLEGASVLILAVISLDRYILMTKASTYHTPRMKKLTLFLLALAWLIPGITPILRWINTTAYLVVTITIFVGPFFILLASYFFIAKAVREQEKRIQAHQIQSFAFNSSQDILVIDSHGSNQSINKIKVASQRSHLKVAKVVTVLLITYFFCITPINTWLILNLINLKYAFLSVQANQNLYLFAILSLSYNSCLNPLIYFWKNLEIRKGFWKLFKVKSRVERI